jgi:histidinol-phosphate aminotransferase
MSESATAVSTIEPTGPRAYSVGPAPPSDVRRLHLNEFRGSHPSAVIAATMIPIHQESLTNYQSGPDSALIDDLARYVDVMPQNILLAAGSDELLRAVIDTSAQRGHMTVIMGVPGYTHFEHFARLRSDLELIRYPIGLCTDAAAHEAALRYFKPHLTGGALVYLCSPNNPTGDMWSREVVGKLAREFPLSLFLVDEAYVEFASVAQIAREGDGGLVKTSDFAPIAKAFNKASLAALAVSAENKNIIVTRTMSKAFGLAALRIGYAVGTASILQSVGVAVSPKAFHLAAAPAAREVMRHLAHYYFDAHETRARSLETVEALKERGWWAMNTDGNFYLVYVGQKASAKVKILAEAGVQVRDRSDLPGLAGFVRVTAGTKEDAEAVLIAFRQLIPPKEKPPQLLYTDKGVVAAVKELMRRVLKVLDSIHFEYWAQSGTMLGMARHGAWNPNKFRWDGGMIPTDDDGDLAYRRTPQGFDPLAEHVRTFEEAHLTLQRNRTDAYWQVGTNAHGHVISPIHIDIFSYSGSEADGYALDDVRFREETPNCPQAHCNTRYSHSELFPLRRDYTFYGMQIPMPAGCEAVLKRCLGADCMRVMRIRRPDGIVEVELEDFSTA